MNKSSRQTEKLLSSTLIMAAKAMKKEVKIIFICALFSVLLLEFVLRQIPAPTEWMYHSGEVYLKICYSIVASTIFFFFNQQLPKQAKKENVYLLLHNSVTEIRLAISSIIAAMNLPSPYDVNCVLYQVLDDAAKKIPLDESVKGLSNSRGIYDNWRDYLRGQTDFILKQIDSVMVLHEVIDSATLSALTRTRSIITSYGNFNPALKWGNEGISGFTSLIHGLNIENQKLLNDVDKELLKKLQIKSGLESVKEGYFVGFKNPGVK